MHADRTAAFQLFQARVCVTNIRNFSPNLAENTSASLRAISRQIHIKTATSLTYTILIPCNKYYFVLSSCLMTTNRYRVSGKHRLIPGMEEIIALNSKGHKKYINTHFVNKLNTWTTNSFSKTLLHTLIYITKSKQKQLLKATITYITSVSPSVQMQQLGSNNADFDATWYLSFSRKYVAKIQASLKSDKHTGYFT